MIKYLLMNKTIKEIINEEIENLNIETDDEVLDEILNELLDMNRGISYIPQGYKHNILDED